MDHKKSYIFIFLLSLILCHSRINANEVYRGHISCLKMIELADQISADKRQQFIDQKFRMIQDKNNFPLMNENEVLFIYKGKVKNIKLTGDMTGWFRKINFNRIKDTDFYYLRFNVENDARLNYQFVVDGRSIPDPLNQNSQQIESKKTSYFSMPEYFNLYLNQNDQNLTGKGRLEKLTLHSQLLKSLRTIQIYYPPGYQESSHYPVLYFQNGLEYINHAGADQILDYLISVQVLRPVIAVFIHTNNSVRDYLLNDQYADFLAFELIPKLEKELNLNQDQNRYLIGKYLGGLSAAYTIYRNPHLFQGIVCQSAALRFTYDKAFKFRDQKYKHTPFARELAQNFLPVKWLMICGTYEFRVDDYNLIKANRKFYEIISENHSLSKVEFQTYNQGHNWIFWKDTLAECLLWLLEY